MHYVFEVAEMVLQYLVRTRERIERLTETSRQCIRDDSMYNFRICEIYRQARILALSLIGVRLVLGLELEGVRCRTQEHFTVMSMGG